MANKQGSAGVSAKEIDISGPLAQLPTGIPAGVIGTANKGPAFVPVTVGLISDFYAKFGQTDGKKFGPLAVYEWLRRAGAVTYLRVLGVGDGLQRVTSGQTAGSVNTAGFVVGNRLPDNEGTLVNNPNAVHGNTSTVLGRTYFLGSFMSESAGSTLFSSAGIQGVGSVTPGATTAVPIIRGILMAPSGVILRLSASDGGTNDPPSKTTVATEAGAYGDIVGCVDFGTNAKQEFVLLINGHKATNPKYPNFLTASFDMTSPSYFTNVFNTSPENIQDAGHYLYAYWDIHPTTATVTGSGLVTATKGAGAGTPPKVNSEAAAFLTTGSLARNLGSTSIPNYESFSDRFGYAKSPWVISQKFGGNSKNLFRFHSLDAGSGVSTQYKISVKNITPSSDPTYKYGTFDIEIRKWDDRDDDVKVLETFSAVSVDPGSDRYIAKIIGDQNVFYDFDRAETAQKLVVEGNYPQRSNYVRVEVSSDVENAYVDPSSMPMGFRGIEHIVSSGSAPLTSVDSISNKPQLTAVNFLKRAITPPLPMRSNIQIGVGQKVVVNPSLCWGVQFEHVTNLSTPNASTLKNDSLKSFAKYFPNFSTINQNFAVSNNEGAADTLAWGIIDADRFCNNSFSLENIKVKTTGAPSTTLADPESWSSAVYVRNGNITADVGAQTRALKVDDINQSNRKFAKFTFFTQGGFDGVNIFDKHAVELSDRAISADMDDINRGLNNGPNVRTYLKALDIMKNVVSVDVQLLAIPGIRHPIITDAASEAVRDRFDAMYIMDVQQYDVNGSVVTSSIQTHSVTNTVQNFSNRAIDNNFVAAYYPDVIMQDPNTLTNIVVPPSVVVLGAMSLNDAIGFPWFAPAGLSRGSLATALEAQVKLSKTNLDDLYNASINPLVAFPSAGNGVNILKPVGGVIVWGQKTLQTAASALDRVNVRRLLIEIRRQVKEISQTVIFEPNRAATLARFSAAITPRLQRIQAQAGLQRFRVIIDSSTTTQQDIENNTIRGKIFVQPTKTIEFVSLDFVVSNNIQQLLEFPGKRFTGEFLIKRL